MVELSSRLDTRTRRPQPICWNRVISYAAIILLAMALWSVRLRGPIDLRYDASVYYALGTSLAEGHGYRIGTEPGAPEGIQYPPLLPAIVALHQHFLGTSDIEVVGQWLRWTYATTFGLFAVAVLALARAYLPPWPALLAAGLCFGQVNTYLYSDLLFTELPFSFLCVLVVLTLGTERLAARVRTREGLAFILASAAYLLRAAGLAVLVAWVGEALLRRKWRLAMLRALLAAIPFGAWQLHVARVQASEEYRHPAYGYQRATYQFYNVTYAENMSLTDPFRPELGRASAGTLIQRLAANLAAVPAGVGESVSNSIGFWRVAVKGVAEPADRPWLNRLSRMHLYFLAGLVLTGTVVLLQRRHWLMALLIACSVFLVCTTPWPEQFSRYLTPLTPFLTIAAVMGGLRLSRFLGGRPEKFARDARWMLAGLALIVVSLQLFSAIFVFRNRQYEKATFVPGRGLDAPRWFYFNSDWVNWEKAVQWVKVRASRDDVVATTSPHLCALKTGLLAVMPPMEHDPEKARSLMDTVPVKWLIVDGLPFLDVARHYAVPAVTGDPLKWRLVQTIGSARVYERVLTTGGARL